MEEMIGSLVDALEELGIEYVIVGGVAVVSWGNLRTTRDVDVVILIREGDAGRGPKTLGKHGMTIQCYKAKSSCRVTIGFCLTFIWSVDAVSRKSLFCGKPAVC